MKINNKEKIFKEKNTLDGLTTDLKDYETEDWATETIQKETEK